MTRNNENERNHLKQRLRMLTEEQYENERALKSLYELKHDFDEWKMHSHRLLDNLASSWHKDRELGPYFLHTQQETEHIKRKITYELEEHQDVLVKEKQQLRELENELHQEQKRLNT